MGREKKFVIDVDGVLADFMLEFRRLAHRYFGVPIFDSLAPNYTSWDLPDLTEMQLDFLWREVRKDPGWWLSLPCLLTDAEKEGLRLWGTDPAIQLYFVTSRVGVNVKVQTEDWITDNLHIPLPTVLITPWKGEAAAALEVDAAIEDKAENAWAIAWFTKGKTRSYLINRPYNQSSLGASKVIRVNTFSEFLAAEDSKK